MNDQQKLMSKLRAMVGFDSSSEENKKSGIKAFAMCNQREDSPYLNLKPLPRQKNSITVKSPTKGKRVLSSHAPEAESSSSSTRKLNNFQDHQGFSNNKVTLEPYRVCIKRFSPNTLARKPRIQKSQEKPNSFSLKYINEKLDSLEKDQAKNPITGYLEVFEEVINKDHIFGKVLKRIKEAFTKFITLNEQTYEYIYSLELKLAEKQSTINQMVMAKAHDISKIPETPRTERSTNNYDAGSQLYTIVPQMEFKFLKDENDHLNKKIKTMQEEANAMEEKEKKYTSLISALRDRGYPVEEVYLKDVQWSSMDNRKDKFSLIGYASCDNFAYNGRIKANKSFDEILSSDESIPDAL